MPLIDSLTPVNAYIILWHIDNVQINLWLLILLSSNVHWQMQWIYGSRICFAWKLLREIGCLQFWRASHRNCHWEEEHGVLHFPTFNIPVGKCMTSNSCMNRLNLSFWGIQTWSELDFFVGMAFVGRRQMDGADGSSVQGIIWCPPSSKVHQSGITMRTSKC